MYIPHIYHKMLLPAYKAIIRHLNKWMLIWPKHVVVLIIYVYYQ